MVSAACGASDRKFSVTPVGPPYGYGLEEAEMRIVVWNCAMKLRGAKLRAM
jgi:hypothetical protein